MWSIVFVTKFKTKKEEKWQKEKWCKGIKCKMCINNNKNKCKILNFINWFVKED